MFLTDNHRRGFTLMFQNGWTIRIRWAGGTYALTTGDPTIGESAEVAAWDADGNDLEFIDGQTERRGQSPEDVAHFAHYVANLSPNHFYAMTWDERV